MSQNTYGYFKFCYITEFFTTYYVLRFFSSGNLVQLFDGNWGFLLDSGSYVMNIIPWNNSLFIISNDGFIKQTDRFLAVIQQSSFQLSYPSTSDLYYSSNSDTLYVSNFRAQTIYMFQRNLTIYDNFTLPALYNPTAINGYNDKIYVGTVDGLILLIVNKIIIQIISTYNSILGINGIFVDAYGFIVPVSPTTLSLFYPNLTLTGLNISSNGGYGVGFDSNNRFVIVYRNYLYFYY